MNGDGERVQVLAPLGRDASLLVEVLRRAGIEAGACPGMDELARAAGDTGALLLTEEALAPAAVPALLAALGAQPAWSDLPVLLLAGGDAPPFEHAPALAALRAAGNLTVLERPVRGLSLVTAVQAALRARRRQYEVRDRIEREHALRQQAEEASRIKEEFLATVSHELRTPLSTIVLWVGLLQGGKVDARRLPEALGAIGRAAKAQSKLVEDLLDVARITAGKISLSVQDTELGPIADAALEVVRPAAEARRIELVRAIDATACPVRIDPDRFQQVIWNLLSNAVKFTPPGGRVTLRVWRDVEHVRVAVSDTGRGISAAFLPHVFERFRQADVPPQPRRGGLGLGLSISQKLVELHGGTIDVQSAGEGRGATFTVALPLVDAREAAPASGRRSAVRGGGRASRRRQSGAH